MRHRARRPLIRRVLSWVPPGAAGRRAAAGAAALVIAGAGVGVAIALDQEGPEPVTSAVPPMTQADTGPTMPTSPDHPSKRVSRSGDRTALPSGTTSPSPSDPTGATAGAPSPSTGSPAPATSLATRTGAGSSGPQPGGGTSTGSAGPSGPGSTGASGPVSSPASDPTTQPVDDVPPATTATTTAVDGSSWTVLLGADEPAGFACSLDGGSFVPCAATATFTGLSHGTHTLAVRATDLAGNTDPTPAQLTAKVKGPA